MIKGFRIALATALWIGIVYFNLALVAAEYWPSQVEGIYIAPFEPLVIANLTFLMFYVTLRE